MNNSPILQIKNVGKSFIDGKIHVDVFKSVTFEVQAGEKIAIIGTSGAGKSTLLHILGGLDQPSTGEVWVGDKNIHQLSEAERARHRNLYLGFIYQFHHLLPEFSVLENVCIPLLMRKMDIEQAEAQALELLTQVHMQHRLTHRLGELSGGERQRVAIARALVTQPKCVLADEPTGNLDFQTAEAVYNVLLELHKNYQTSFIIVTHDLNLAKKMDKIYELCNGTLVPWVHEKEA